MANATDHPDRRFPLDFGKLNGALLEHVNGAGAACEEVGDCFISTSIFSLPSDFDDWRNQYDDITAESIEKVRRAVAARDARYSSAGGRISHGRCIPSANPRLHYP